MCEVNQFEMPVKQVFSSALMDLLKEKFEAAAKELKSMRGRPSNDTFLQLYSLYKQSILGDNRQAPPDNPYDFMGRAKHQAWASLQGKPADEAMKEYINLVKKLR